MTEHELLESMNQLNQKQQRCLKLQMLLIVMTVAFFKFGVVLLFIHVAILILYSNTLSSKATLLARKKYPYVPIGPYGKGSSWDPYIIEEAKRLNDNLTVRILKYNIWTVCCVGAALLGYIFVWILSSLF